jgi:hypothetical protein
METAHEIELRENSPTAFSGFQPELNVVLVYEDFEMGMEGKKVFDMIAGEAGGADAARLTVWKFDFFHSPELTRALSLQAAEADVIIVAPRCANYLPPQVKNWLEEWPPRRRIPNGALVSLFHPEEAAASRTSEAALLLWRAAERAGMEFFCRTFSSKSDPAATTRSASSASYICDTKPSMVTHHRQWGVNE